MGKGSRKKNKSAAASGSTSSPSHQETPNQPLPQSCIKEKKEALEEFEKLIKDMKTYIESANEDLDALNYYSTVLSAALRALKPMINIRTMIPNPDFAIGLSNFRKEIHKIISDIPKEACKIISDAIIRGQIVECSENSQTIRIWRKRCRQNMEMLENMIRKEYCGEGKKEDEFAVKVLCVILKGFMPVLRLVLGCKQIYRKNGQNLKEMAEKLLKGMERDLASALFKAVMETHLPDYDVINSGAADVLEALSKAVIAGEGGGSVTETEGGLSLEGSVTETERGSRQKEGSVTETEGCSNQEEVQKVEIDKEKEGGSIDEEARELLQEKGKDLEVTESKEAIGTNDVPSSSNVCAGEGSSSAVAATDTTGGEED